MILVTGAAGKTGLAVISALAGKGRNVRALTRSENKAELVKKAGAKEIVTADLLDTSTAIEATQGVDAIYLICPNVHPKEFEIGQTFIDAATKNGVLRFVYHSVMYPQVEAMPHHWQKLHVEEALVQSDLQFTILQPAIYMQNVLPYWEAITQRGEYLVPYSVDSLFSPVDLEDIAEIASKVLTEGDHGGTIYQLSGPQRLTSTQMAEAMCGALSRSVKALPQSIGEWETVALERGLTAYAIDTLSKMFAYYDQHGFAGSCKALECLLGRPATNFAQFLARVSREL